ncbi:hypothetical protein ENUP19_0347G0004 [Entamoeba nuttalli]|uniref:Leucine-rich repeat containing protein n=2 Tax=Entamoeba nuttalli TaxID=412467 RepID=K2HRM5_ENTNP|nr:hypothetical protein ENU1_159600 [Entamoeba nuttalli P19]EKE38635.1 hypothetical protein ENU1_159600 [Entamoeba nuttalli P19]|eukprot:XP_008859031.1 hypothetical protein ENU1_159600 [Entamoeba nuttalli P19]
MEVVEHIEYLEHERPHFTLNEFAVIAEYIHDLSTITQFVFISKNCKETFDTLSTTLLPFISPFTMTPIELTVTRTLSLLKVLKYFPQANCIQCDTDTVRILPENVFTHYSFIEIKENEEPLNIKEHFALIKSIASKLVSLSIKIDEEAFDFPPEIHFSEMISLKYLSITFTQNETFDYAPKSKVHFQRFSRLQELKLLPRLQLLSVNCEQSTAILLAPIFRELQCIVNVILLYSEDNVDIVKEVMSSNVIVCCEYDSTMTEYTRLQTTILQHEGLSVKVETVGSMNLFEELMENTLASNIVIYERVPKWMTGIDLTTYTHIQNLQIEGKAQNIEINIPTSVTSLKMNTIGYSISNIDDIPLKELKLENCDLNPILFSNKNLKNIEIKSCAIHTTFVCPSSVSHFSLSDSELQVQLNDGLEIVELGTSNRTSTLQLPKSVQILSTEISVSMLSLPNLQRLDISKLPINIDLFPTTLTSLRILMGSSKKQMDMTKFRKLEKLSIIVCEKVRRIVLPHQLRFLMVYGCKDIVALDNLKNGNLEELCVTECNNLQMKIPQSIKRCFVDIPSVTSVKF